MKRIKGILFYDEQDIDDIICEYDKLDDNVKVEIKDYIKQSVVGGDRRDLYLLYGGGEDGDYFYSLDSAVREMFIEIAEKFGLIKYK